MLRKNVICRNVQRKVVKVPIYYASLIDKAFCVRSKTSYFGQIKVLFSNGVADRYQAMYYYNNNVKF